MGSTTSLLYSRLSSLFNLIVHSRSSSPMIIREDNFIIAIDVGTTTIRGVLFDGELKIVQEATLSLPVTKINSVNEDGEALVEIDPKTLYGQFLEVLLHAYSKVPKDAKVRIVFCNQRNSLVFWNKESKEEVSNIICWNDRRAAKAVDAANSSLAMKLINISGGVLHALTRKPKFAAAKRYAVQNGMIIHRLTVTLSKNDAVKRLHQAGDVAFGCLETWLLMKMGRDNPILAESSCISVSGVYDPFANQYNNLLVKLFGVPPTLLPVIVDSSLSSIKKKLVLDKKFLGRKLQITAVLADQQAAMFGCGQWDEGAVKITLGTGTFVNVHTGKTPKTSMSGLYPVVGWCLNGENDYLLEGCAHDTVLILKWAQSFGLFTDVTTTSDIAFAVKHSNGLLFIPGFCGIQAPINNDGACAGFLGLKPDTTLEHMLCAVLQAIGFRVYQIYLAAAKDVTISSKFPVRICGGVSNNNFICQVIADLLDRNVERLENSDHVSARGVAMLSSLANGEYTKDELAKLVIVDEVFQPDPERRIALLETFENWSKAMTRSLSFYD